MRRRRAQTVARALPRGCGAGIASAPERAGGLARAALRELPAARGGARARGGRGAGGERRPRGRRAFFALYSPLHFISSPHFHLVALRPLCRCREWGPRPGAPHGPSVTPPCGAGSLCLRLTGLSCPGRVALDQGSNLCPRTHRLPRNHWTWAWDLISEGHSFLLSKEGGLIPEGAVETPSR